jgi:hypothetical protein
MATGIAFPPGCRRNLESGRQASRADPAAEGEELRALDANKLKPSMVRSTTLQVPIRTWVSWW